MCPPHRACPAGPNVASPPQDFEQRRKDGDKVWRAWTREFDSRRSKRNELPPEAAKARKEADVMEKQRAADEAFKAW